MTTICRYCGRDHDARILCRGVSRRSFFFFGAAAAVAAVVPTPAAPDFFAFGKGVWQFLKTHPGTIDRVKFEHSGVATDTFDGARKVPIDWGALRRSGQVDPVLTQISLSYNPGGPDYALAIHESGDRKTWSKL